MLDRLVCRAVFADADGVVGPHVGDRQIHEGGEAHRAAHEVGEHEERAAVSAGEAVGGDTVERGTHREFAHAKVEVTAELVAAEGRRGTVRGQERGLALQERVVRAGEVGGTAPQFGQHRSDRVEDLAGGSAGRDGLALFEGGQRGLPALGQAAFEEALKQGSLLGVRGLPPLEAGVPVLAVFGCASGRAGADLVDERGISVEHLLGIGAQRLLETLQCFGTELGTVNTAGVLLAGGRPADDGAQRDERGLPRLGLGGVEGVVQGCRVLLVGAILAEPVDALDVPAVGLVAGQDILVESDRRVVFDGDVVVVPDDGNVAELLGACEGGSLSGDALFEAAIASDDVDVVVEDGLTERGLGIQQAVDAAGVHGEADGGGDAGTQRAGRDFDALGVAVLGVAGGQGASGAQLLDVIKFEPEAREVELDVLGQRGVAGREDETVASDPARVGRIDVHDLVVEEVGRGGERDRSTGVARSCLLDGVGGEELSGLDRFVINVIPVK